MGRYASSIEEKKAQLQANATELENTTAKFGENNQANFKLQGQVNDLLYQKQLNVERRLLSGQQSLDNVKEIITGLTQMHPHLHEVLSRVLAMADPGIEW